LMWVVDGISYQVGGLDLTFDQVLEIAQSLH
jgi:hypothetical protein